MHAIKLITNLYWNKPAISQTQSRSYRNEMCMYQARCSLEICCFKQGVRSKYAASLHFLITRSINGKGVINLRCTVVNNLRYTYDTVIIAESKRRAATTDGHCGTEK